MHTRKRLVEFDAATVPLYTVIWLKGATAEEISAFLDRLSERGLDLRNCGPGDRYQVMPAT